MTRLFLLVVLISSCQTSVHEKSTVLNQDGVVISMVNTWLDQNNYPIDSTRYTIQVVYSNGLGPTKLCP